MGWRWRVKIDCLRNNPAVALPVRSRNDSASTRGGIKIPLWASSNRSGSTEAYLFVLSPSSQASCSGPLAYLRRPSRTRTPSPWVASLLVLALHRGKKIGSNLVAFEMLLKQTYCHSLTLLRIRHPGARASSRAISGVPPENSVRETRTPHAGRVSSAIYPQTLALSVLSEMICENALTLAHRSGEAAFA